MVTQVDGAVEAASLTAFRRRRDGRNDLPPLPLRPLIAEYTATFGSTWRPVTRRKHADDFARLVAWLTENGKPVTTASLDFPTLVDPETRAALCAYLEGGRPILVEQARMPAEADPGWLFVSACQSDGVQPLSMNAVSLMLTRRYHAGGGSLR